MSRPPGLTQTFTAPTMEEAVAEAIPSIVMATGQRASDGTSLLVFSGEGPTPEAALRGALDDIRDLCIDHQCTPSGVTTDGVMDTDVGTRIWGTVSCDPGMTAAMLSTEVLEFSITQEGGLWSLVVTRQ